MCTATESDKGSIGRDIVDHPDLDTPEEQREIARYGKKRDTDEEPEKSEAVA